LLLKVQPTKRMLRAVSPAFGSMLTPAWGDWPRLPLKVLPSTVTSEACTIARPVRRLFCETQSRTTTCRQPWFPVSRIPSR
jgi:hypothetical protein